MAYNYHCYYNYIIIIIITALCNMPKANKVEQKEDCYEAVKVVMEAKYDYSGGATYFENCADEDNWCSKILNLCMNHKEDFISKE